MRRDLRGHGDHAGRGVRGHVVAAYQDMHDLILGHRRAAPCRPARVHAGRDVGAQSRVADLEELDLLDGALVVVEVRLVDPDVHEALLERVILGVEVQLRVGRAATLRAPEGRGRVELRGPRGHRHRAQLGQRRVRRLPHRSHRGLGRDQTGDHGDCGEEVALVRALVDDVGDLRSNAELAAVVDEMVQGHVPQAREHWPLRRRIAPTHHGEAVSVDRRPIDHDEGEPLAAVLVVEVRGVHIEVHLAIAPELPLAVEELDRRVGDAPGRRAREGPVVAALQPGARLRQGLARVRVRHLGAPEAVVLVDAGLEPSGVPVAVLGLLARPVVLHPLAAASHAPGPGLYGMVAQARLQRGVVRLPGMLRPTREGLMEPGAAVRATRVDVVRVGLVAIQHTSLRGDGCVVVPGRLRLGGAVEELGAQRIVAALRGAASLRVGVGREHDLMSNLRGRLQKGHRAPSALGLLGHPDCVRHSRRQHRKACNACRRSRSSRSRGHGRYRSTPSVHYQGMYKWVSLT
mmetsp:Transcript_8986/g.23216  ORF Transcript_8986/g.23216 Transcript_8986/m.23216 type:complete len:517 (-) Transcript_8986:10-1560(-)